MRALSDCACRFEDFYAEEDEGQLLTEWVETLRISPLPPPSPPDFFDKIGIGDPVEYYLNEGWWEVQLQKTRKEAEGVLSLRVASTLYNTSYWVAPSELRPRWTFDRTQTDMKHWVAEAPAGLDVWELCEEGSAEPRAATSALQPAAAQGGDDGGATKGALSLSTREALLLQHEAVSAGACVAEAEAEVEVEVEAEVEAEAEAEVGVEAEAEAEVEVEAACDGAEGSSSRLDQGQSAVAENAARRRLSAVHKEVSQLRGQLDWLQRLATDYHARVCEVSDAALRIFPLAQSAVFTAGGELPVPECFSRPLPPAPPTTPQPVPPTPQPE